jgi:hypothetical protein
MNTTKRKERAKRERASETVKVQVTPTEQEQVKHRAKAKAVTVSNLFRQGVGLPELKRGGAMEGAGRPRKTDHGKADHRKVN